MLISFKTRMLSISTLHESWLNRLAVLAAAGGADAAEEIRQPDRATA